jgi:mannosyltransferase OCH1-like enzyme
MSDTLTTPVVVKPMKNTARVATVPRAAAATARIPKIIHQTAPTTNLTWEERRITGRMLTILAGWQYHLWDDNDNERFVAGHFPQYVEQFRRIERGVVKADLARYMYLYVHGGFYFDTDYKMMAPIGEDILSRACVLPVSRGDVNNPSTMRLGNAVMGSVPRHAFWSNFLRELFNTGKLETLAEDRIEKTTGPEGLTDFFLRHREKYTNVFLAPRSMFHPPLRARTFSYQASSDTIGAHLCWGSWRTKNVLRLARNVFIRKLTAL